MDVHHLVLVLRRDVPQAQEAGLDDQVDLGVIENLRQSGRVGFGVRHLLVGHEVDGQAASFGSFDALALARGDYDSHFHIQSAGVDFVADVQQSPSATGQEHAEAQFVG